MSELQNWWQSHYGSAVPVAHIRRQQIQDRWFRIHSLPESKRYPKTPEEYSILLARQNKIATEVLGSQTQCLLLVARYTNHPELDIHSQHLPQIEGANFKLFASVQEPDTISVYCAPIIWSPGRFDSVIKSVADEQDAHILFAALETVEAYHPYDGGADLFLASSERRDIADDRYVATLFCMGKAYSSDLRLRVLSAIDGRMSKMTAHKTFCVSRSSIDDWIELRAHTGLVDANTSYQRGPKPGITNEQMLDFAREHDGCTLAQMVEAWHAKTGQERSTRFFSRALQRIGWTRKKRVFSSASAMKEHEASS
jgi:transposase